MPSKNSGNSGFPRKWQSLSGVSSIMLITKKASKNLWLSIKVICAEFIATLAAIKLKPQKLFATIAAATAFLVVIDDLFISHNRKLCFEGRPMKNTMIQFCVNLLDFFRLVLCS